MEYINSRPLVFDYEALEKAQEAMEKALENVKNIKNIKSREWRTAWENYKQAAGTYRTMLTAYYHL